jgi:predicted HTH transcriptional regulator
LTISQNDPKIPAAKRVITRDEDHFFDRKALMASGKTVQKIAVAFANSDGGEFVVGVADTQEESIPQNRWNGDAKVEDFNGHLQALSEVKPPLPMEFSILEATGSNGLILLVRVEKRKELRSASNIGWHGIRKKRCTVTSHKRNSADSRTPVRRAVCPLARTPQTSRCVS